MKAILIIVFMTISVLIFAQEYNHKQIDTKGDILVGLCNTKAFAEAPFSDWFNRETEDYKPDLDIVKYLKQFAGKYQVTVVMGTWCSDSRREVPRFFKVMNMVGYSPNTIKIICVDSDKVAGELDISGLKLEKVPTFIVTISGKEIGRIVETPEKTIETDLYNIIKNNK